MKHRIFSSIFWEAVEKYEVHPPVLDLDSIGLCYEFCTGNDVAVNCMQDTFIFRGDGPIANQSITNNYSDKPMFATQNNKCNTICTH